MSDDCEGEIHAVGFDEDKSHKNARRAFQVFGIQNWKQGYQTNPAYTVADMGSYVHFSIPVGQYYTGSSMYLVLVNDDDRIFACGSAWYSNVQIYEK